MQNMVTGCTVMMNRALLRRALPIPDGVLMHDWWLGLVAAAFGEIRFVPQATMFYRQHGKNDTGAKKFSMTYVLQAFLRIRSSAEFWRLLRRNQFQAELFVARFHGDMTPEQVEDLQRFANMSAHTRIQDRLHTIFMRNFCRHGWIRNLGLAVRLAIS